MRGIFFKVVYQFFPSMILMIFISKSSLKNIDFPLTILIILNLYNFTHFSFSRRFFLKFILIIAHTLMIHKYLILFNLRIHLKELPIDSINFFIHIIFRITILFLQRSLITFQAFSYIIFSLLDAPLSFLYDYFVQISIKNIKFSHLIGGLSLIIIEFVKGEIVIDLLVYVHALIIHVVCCDERNFFVFYLIISILLQMDRLIEIIVRIE